MRPNVAAGEADLAVQPVSEILVAPGVDFAGSLAPEIQFVQVFSAAIVAGSQALENSRRLIAFLASARAADAIKNSGMEPLATATVRAVRVRNSGEPRWPDVALPQRRPKSVA